MSDADGDKLVPLAARMKAVSLPQQPHDPFEHMPRGSLTEPMFTDAFRFFLLRLIDSYDTARSNEAHDEAYCKVHGRPYERADGEQRAHIDRAMRYLTYRLRAVSADDVVRRMGGIYAAFARYVETQDATHFELLDENEELAGHYDRPTTDAEKVAIYRNAFHAHHYLVTTIWMLTGTGPLVSFFLADDVPPDSWLRRSEDAD
jgi:hypothetical protein